MTVSEHMPSIRKSLRPRKPRQLDVMSRTGPVKVLPDDCSADISLPVIQSELIHNSMITVDTTNNRMASLRHFTRRFSLAMKPNSSTLKLPKKKTSPVSTPIHPKRNSFQAWRRRKSFTPLKQVQREDDVCKLVGVIKNCEENKIRQEQAKHISIDGYMIGSRKRPLNTSSKSIIPRRKSLKLNTQPGQDADDGIEITTFPRNNRLSRSFGHGIDTLVDTDFLYDEQNTSNKNNCNDSTKELLASEGSSSTASGISLKLSASTTTISSISSMNHTSDDQHNNDSFLEPPATVTLGRRPFTTRKNYQQFDFLEPHEEPQSIDMGKVNLRAGTTLFNIDPIKGMNYLINYNLIEMNPRKIAEFLRGENVNRSSIGEYFGCLKDPLAPKVATEMMEAINLRGLKLDQALRLLLRCFRPVGESQKIASILTKFKDIYVEQNVEMIDREFRSKETIETLAYSILILHTSHFNPNASKHSGRMTLEDFISMTRDIDDGHPLTKSYITDIYNRVTEEEFQCSRDITNVMKELDKIIIGPKKTNKFLLPYRNFIGWVFVQEIELAKLRNGARNDNGHLRALFIFNDVVLVTKASNYGNIAKTGIATPTGSQSSLNSNRRSMFTLPRSPNRALSPVEPTNEKDTAQTYIPQKGKFTIKYVINLKEFKFGEFNILDHNPGIILSNKEDAYHFTMFSREDFKLTSRWLQESIEESILVASIR